MSTTTTPATAITATFSTVTLAGGAARLLARLRLSRATMYTPASATAATMTIQPAIGLMAPYSMSFRMLLFSRMVPPEPGAAALIGPQQQSLAQQQPGQRHHERRQLEPGDDHALNRAVGGGERQPGQHRQPPGDGMRQRQHPAP